MRDCQTYRTIKLIRRTGLPMLKRNRSCRGQSLVEFTLVAMFFFLLAFGAIDFCWLLFNQMNMQDAVREAARYASTGQSVQTTPPQPFPRANSITQVLNKAAVGTQIQNVVISNSASGAVCNSSGASAGCAGGPGDTVTIQAVCKVPLLTTALGSFFTGSQFTFTVRASFKNEPFLATQTN